VVFIAVVLNGTLINIVTQCKRARTALMSKLYGTVELKTNNHCTTTLEAFSKQQEITQHIHTLIVRPNNVERTSSGDFLDESFVSNVIVRMCGRLPALKAFVWDGEEMPGDGLWHSLRKSLVKIQSHLSVLNSLLETVALF
jgi:hypothetical protein